MKKLITCLSFALAAVSVGYAAVTPLWMRDARISPDGSEIVFCYKGDIYKVSAQGGTAVQLTTQASYEANRSGRPMESRLLLPATAMGILTFLLCLPMEVLPGD